MITTEKIIDTPYGFIEMPQEISYVIIYQDYVEAICEDDTVYIISRDHRKRIIVKRISKK